MFYMGAICKKCLGISCKDLYVIHMATLVALLDLGPLFAADFTPKAYLYFFAVPNIHI
jgi:hypothetical protein